MMPEILTQIIPLAQMDTKPNQARFRTVLNPAEEYAFAQWSQKHNIPVGNGIFRDPGPLADYDMRGFWKAMIMGDPQAVRAANLHFPDTYKTPFHESFSNESKYAPPDAPRWDGNKLIDKSGKVVFDEDKR